MFSEEVKKAQGALAGAMSAHLAGERQGALDRLQSAMEAIQAAGGSLDGVMPPEEPMLPDHEMWGWPRNGGRG